MQISVEIHYVLYVLMTCVIKLCKTWNRYGISRDEIMPPSLQWPCCVYILQAVLTIADVCVMFAQFYDQSELMRNSSGQPYAHYRAVQYGALRSTSVLERRPDRGASARSLQGVAVRG